MMEVSAIPGPNLSLLYPLRLSGIANRRNISWEILVQNEEYLNSAGTFGAEEQLNGVQVIFPIGDIANLMFSDMS